MMRLLLLSVCSLMLFSASAFEQTSPNQGENIIEVIGDGEITLTPDTIAVNLVLKDESRQISKAKMLIEQQSRQIKQVAASLGLPPESIRWQQVAVRPLYKEDAVQVQALEVPHTLSPGKEARVFISPLSGHKDNELETFELSRQLSIRFSDHGLYQQFLQRAVSLGIKDIFPAPLKQEEYQAYYQQALDNAVLNAKTKARHLAKQTGIKLGNLFSLREVALPANASEQGAYWLQRRGAGDYLPPKIRARAIVSFRIIP